MLALENKDEAENKSLIFPEVSRNADALFAPHFGLQQQPFVSSLDRRQFYSHESALEVLNTLQYSLRSGEGITKITGESGVGKTYLTANLLASMHDDFFVVKLLNPASTSTSLLKTILDELCIDYRDDLNNQQLLKLIMGALCVFYAKYDHPVVLSIDNAERMSVAALATLTALNNLETQHRKLLQIILIGTPELDEKLEHPALQSLRQRISFTANLKALSKEQTVEYVSERVNNSSDEGAKLFSAEALNALYKATRGIPRLINLISYKGMMLAYGKGFQQIQKDHILEAAKDTNQIKEVQPSRIMFFVYIPFALAILGCIALAAQLIME